MIPYIKFYTNKFIGRHADASTRMFFILIRPEQRDNKALLAHELEHVKQGWLTLFIGHALLYKMSKKYRYWSELKAYRAQLRGIPENEKEEAQLYFSWALANYYGIGKDEEEILADLKKMGG